MTESVHPKLPWETAGVRLHWPRDGHAAYVVGRMGVVRSVDVWPLLYGSHGAGKIGFARLQRLGLLRMFPRAHLSEHAWYGLVPEAASWLAEAMGCEESELRIVYGVSRMNLSAVRDRNRFWAGVVLACRSREGARVALVRPEWELRRSREAGTRTVPDLQLVLEVSGEAGTEEFTWFVEFDAGTERLAVLEAKAKAYQEAARLGAFYGELGWRVLVLVPTPRRARSVAAAMARSGAEATWVAVQSELEEARALEPRLWSVAELAAEPKAGPRWSLVGSAPIREGEPQPRSAADRGSSSVSRGDSR